MTPLLNILHVEDNKHDAESIHVLLRNNGISFTATCVDTHESLSAALLNNQFDLVLSDYDLQTFDGKEAIHIVRKHSRDIPLIFISETTEENIAIEMLKKGATDYVFKNRLDKLPSAIERALREAREKKALKELEQQLFHAQRMESIGTLAGGIAHDFNNILAIIMGHASLLEKYHSNPEKFAKSVQTILQATRRGAALVSQLLTFSRQQEKSVESIQINDAVRELTKLLGEIVSKNISISTNLEDPLPDIEADATQLQQVLLNLCVNARDAMPKGGTLSLSTQMIAGPVLRAKFLEASDSFYIVLHISDTGTGMSEETRKRIFEPFYTTKAQGKGTGLGLAVAYGIIQTHKGFIDVTSKLGEGTTFSLYFPAKQTHTQRIHHSNCETADVPGGHESVLVVEDEVVLRDLLKLTLESKGYTVYIAKDGEEAVEIYKYHYLNIDLVLCDFQLPKFDGHEVLKRLKAINPDVKLILATGYVEMDQKNTIINDGASDIIQKPYVPEEVLRVMRETFDKNSQAANAE